MSPGVPFFYYEVVFAVASFVLGAVVGSFLNVCIYRMPLNMSVNEPKRSFCPNCKAQIAWYHNLPVVSWLALHGRCANCHQRISARYPLVELLTAGLFLLVFWRFHEAWSLLLPYWIFVALLIVATFIDFDHFIIPDEITVGGTVVGVLLSLAVPLLMGEEKHVMGLFWSLVAAAIGYGLLWGVVELGKLAFGKKKVVLPEPEDFSWTRKGEDAELVIAGETDLWSEFFSREKDQLVLQCDQLTLAGQRHENVALLCFYNRVVLEGTTHPLEKLDAFSGRLREFVFSARGDGVRRREIHRVHRGVPGLAGRVLHRGGGVAGRVRRRGQPARARAAGAVAQNSLRTLFVGGGVGVVIRRAGGSGVVFASGTALKGELAEGWDRAWLRMVRSASLRCG